MAELFVGGLLDPNQPTEQGHERTGGDARLETADFTTHGVIVGMTGSGKTGLGVVIIEEVLSAGLPALLIDPKGDLTNLCLTFPDLAPESFRPWIDEAQANAARQTPAEYAAAQAANWREGLARWGYGPEQIQKLRDTCDFTIYTPGSRAGQPIDIVGSLRVPDTDDPETIGDEIEGYVSALLGLVKIEADPLASREHILLSNVIQHAWSNQQAARPRHARRPGATAADQQARRLRARPVLPAEGPPEAGDAAQRAARITFVRGVGRRRPTRGPGPPVPAGRQAALCHRHDRPSLRRRAPVRDVAAARQGRHVDAAPERHHRPADAALHGRGRRVSPADRNAADEEADHDADEAGARVRRRRGAGHPEPGGHRLQGDQQRRDVDGRPAADRAGQGPPALRHERRRRRRGHQLGERHDQRPEQARVRAAPGRQGHAGPVHDPLGDELPARSDDQGPDQAARGERRRGCRSGDVVRRGGGRCAGPSRGGGAASQRRDADRCRRDRGSLGRRQRAVARRCRR